MKLSIPAILIICSSIAIGANNCQTLQKRLERVEKKIVTASKKRKGSNIELKFQRKKLKSKIEKDCTALDQKLESAFIKSSLISQ